MALDPTDVRQAPVAVQPATMPQTWNATPAQIQNMYDYANALTKNSMGTVPGTKGGWTVGLQHLVEALVGGKEAYNANQLQKQAMMGGAGTYTSGIPKPPADAPAAPTNDQSDAPSKKTALREGADETPSKGGSTPIRVASNGMPPISVPVQEMPPTGPTTGGSPMAGGAPTAAPSPVRLAANGQAAISAALSPGGGVAPGKGGIPVATPQNTVAPPGNYGTVPIAPSGIIPPRSTFNQAQLTELLSNPYADPALKTNALQLYFGTQVNPQVVTVPGGKEFVSPDRKQRLFVPDIQHGSIKYPGGYERPTMETYDPYSHSVIRAPVVTPEPGQVVRPGPQSMLNTPPPVEPGNGPALGTNMPPVTPGNGPALAFNDSIPPRVVQPPPAVGKVADPFNNRVDNKVQDRVPSGGPFQSKPVGQPPVAPPIVPGAEQAAAQTPVKVASLDPTAGITPPGVPNPGGPLNVPPPNVKVASNDEAIPGTNIPPQRLPQGIPAQDADIINYFNNKEVRKAGQLEAVKENAQQYSKRYDTYQKDASAARENRPLVDMARNILNDPNSGVYTGTGSDAVLNWQRVKAAYGSLFGDDKLKGAASGNEIFRKLIAGSILSQLKPLTQGTGQIRNAEISLIEKYNASPLNTLAANKALIEISDRALKRMDMFADMAADYAAGSEVVNPLNGKVILPANVQNGEQTARGGLDFGWDKTLAKFIKENPAFTKEETANFNNLLEHDKKVKPAPEQKFQTPDAEAIKILQTNPNAKPYFDMRFGPGSADKYLTPTGTK